MKDDGNLTVSNLQYGRRNVLLDSSQQTLAEILEILLPFKDLSGLEKDLAQR